MVKKRESLFCCKRADRRKRNGEWMVEKELKQLVESAWGFWNIAQKTISKMGMQAVVGNVSGYLTGSKAKAENHFDIPYLIAAERKSDAKPEKFFDISAAARGNAAYQKNSYAGKNTERYSVDQTVLKVEKLMGQSGAAASLKEGDVIYSAEDMVAGTDKGRLEANNTINSYAENIVLTEKSHVISQIVKELITMTSLFSQGITTEAITGAVEQDYDDYGYMPQNGIQGTVRSEAAFIYPQKGVVDNTRSLNAKENLNIAFGFRETDQKEKAAYQSAIEKNIDIKFIGDALAKQLHEQIASGFPMYVG